MKLSLTAARMEATDHAILEQKRPAANRILALALEAHCAFRFFRQAASRSPQSPIQEPGKPRGKTELFNAPTFH
jgi:hypothetical protein